MHLFRNGLSVLIVSKNSLLCRLFLMIRKNIISNKYCEHFFTVGNFEQFSMVKKSATCLESP